METFKLMHSLDEKGVEQLWQLFQEEWWTQGRTLAETSAMLRHSDEVFALMDNGEMLAGFARVITDYVFKALVLDIIIADAHRGRGLGRVLIQAVMDHPALAGVNHFELYCLPEMMPLYEKWGFTSDLGALQFMRREKTR